MKLYKIKKSGIDKKGKGLYATRDIKEGTKIINYIGKLITKNKLLSSRNKSNKPKINGSKPKIPKRINSFSHLSNNLFFCIIFFKIKLPFFLKFLYNYSLSISLKVLTNENMHSL